MSGAGASIRVLVIWTTILTCAGLWLGQVNKHVPANYLDEVFHIRQAQAYCAGLWKVWDPKITTPPGLYVLSVGLSRIVGDCSTAWLRQINGPLVAWVAHLSYRILSRLSTGSTKSDTPNTNWRLVHRAINIALFPPLFFFSGLYYTDVGSTAFVLLAYYLFLAGGHKGSSILYLPIAVASLSFRQTNIFWVAIFPAAQSLFNLAEGSSDATSSAASSEDPSDPDMSNASVTDLPILALSTILIVIKKFNQVIVRMSPFLALVALFGVFIVYNGGVVLGDKSNHVATLHTPQMLYLWPYMLFFSWPLALPAMIRWLQGTSPASKLRTLVVLLLCCLLALVSVHNNTIVHPFTLADNRHYVFYVFRILMRHPLIKYAAVPIYVLSGFLIVLTLGGSRLPALAPSKVKSQKAKPDQKVGSEQTQADRGCSLSFLVSWVATATLTLITAPLVEPRYCILPWVIWRLYVPQQGSPQASSTSSQGQSSSILQKLLAFLANESTQLWLETLNFLLINAATGYIFLHKGFTWPQEPGLIQRFMW